MIHVWLNNNRFEILRDVHELKDLIESEMGKGVASEVGKLIAVADYNELKIDTDLTAYELQLESFNSMGLEAVELLGRLIEEVHASNRLKRNEILKQLNAVKRLIENEI